MMKYRTTALAIGLALVSGAVQAAGPLYLTDTSPPRPFTWNMASGPIPVYTDGGGAFTWQNPPTNSIPFITVERADEITAFAFKQWTDVATATFSAELAGKYADVLGIPDITGANAGEVYEKQNGYGFWVNYDTDGSILEQYFGVSRNSVLGIAFPEWADEQGNITEATAVLNGWYVDVTDTQGNFVAGVFTHEFGHAINLSHSQVNGPMYYTSQPTSTQYYPGVPGCVAPVHRWDSTAAGANKAPLEIIETMYPFINSRRVAGQAQSTITHPDDVAAISNLYSTADYYASRGSISGVLRLKDGKTEFSGINVIARNVANPLYDAVSAMTGDQTQGRVGPDGSFRINNLAPGQDYVVYIEQIVAGGYPTTPMRLVSQAEYWDAAESTSPANDLPCNATPIRAEAGVAKQADIYFNGYRQGVDFVPIVAAFLTDLSKDGNRSAGLSGTTAFIWDKVKGIQTLPAEFKANNGSMTRNGQKMLVNWDPDGNGFNAAALWSPTGAISLGDLNGDTCGGSSTIGRPSSYGWAVDDAGRIAVGTAYRDADGNGTCTSAFKGEILPFVWDATKGMRTLDTSPLDVTKTQYVRAHAISGNGRVILGADSGARAVAWIDQGPLVNLYTMFGSREAYAANYNGTKVAIQRYVPVGTGTATKADEVMLWNPFAPAGTAPRAIGGLRWCVDLPYIAGGVNRCGLGADAIYAQIGMVPLLLSDISDDGSVLIGRAGSFSAGFVGVMWIDGIGWIKWNEFFRKQGVAEAYAIPFDNPISISASGTEMVGGITGSSYSWWANIDQVFVCVNGVSVQTGFPNGLREKVAAGAVVGRCEHL